jgi:hypothetical protein
VGAQGAAAQTISSRDCTPALLLLLLLLLVLVVAVVAPAAVVAEAAGGTVRAALCKSPAPEVLLPLLVLLSDDMKAVGRLLPLLPLPTPVAALPPDI